MFLNYKMEAENIIEDINYICFIIAIFIFLFIKFLKYLISKERLKIKKSESLFNSVNNSGSPNSI